MRKNFRHRCHSIPTELLGMAGSVRNEVEIDRHEMPILDIYGSRIHPSSLDESFHVAQPGSIRS
jgi:hypothetical protein